MANIDGVKLTSWDPLSTDTTDLGTVSAAQKRELQNILKSYTGYHDLFAELVQNALDAVERRISDNDPDYEPSIWVSIDIGQGVVSITDNGCGMTQMEFRQFLRPNFSFKDARSNRGNKGVGATYLAYGFNYLEIATKIHGQSQYGLIRQGRAWVEDSTGTVTKPVVEIVPPSDKHFKEIDRGTCMSVRLEGSGIRPNDLTWIGSTTADQWLAILRVHSPLGGIYICGDQPKPITVNIEVVDSEGKATQTTFTNPQFLYPHDAFGNVVDIRDYLADQKARAGKGLDVTTPPLKYRHLNGLWGEWTGDAIFDPDSDCPITTRGFDDRDRALASSLGLKLHIFLGFSTSLWDSYNDAHLKLRKGYRLLRGGTQLATRNMPQGPLLRIPMTSNIGLQNQAQVLIHLQNAEPDLGRKGFQPDVVRIAEKLSVSAVNALFEHYKLLRKPGAVSLYTEALALDQWKNEQLNHESKYPLVITGTGLFSPTEELPIRSEPLVEQDVVALFNQMLSSGVIRGLQLISSSQYRQYDALFRILMTSPFDRFIYDSERNPLGLDAEIFQEQQDLQSPIQVLEYKHTVDGLVEELQTEVKFEQDIHMVVAWELGEKWRQQFDVISYFEAEHRHLRDIHGATHLFTNLGSGTHAFKAIILADLVGYLIDPEGEEARQRCKLSPVEFFSAH